MAHCWILFTEVSSWEPCLAPRCEDGTFVSFTLSLNVPLSPSYRFKSWWPWKFCFKENSCNSSIIVRSKFSFQTCCDQPVLLRLLFCPFGVPPVVLPSLHPHSCRPSEAESLQPPRCGDSSQNSSWLCSRPRVENLNFVNLFPGLTGCSHLSS